MFGTDTKSIRNTILVIVLFISALFTATYFLIHLSDEHQRFETNLCYYILAISSSAIIIYLANLRAYEAIEQSRLNYLLNIDERWLSSEIIEAREVIHELYLSQKKKNPLAKNDEIKSGIAQSIMELKDQDGEKEIKKFIKLLNFLDFLETIGYLHYKNSISTDEIDELLGNSIIYFYDIFSRYIIYRRESKDDYFYTKLESMYLAVRERKNKKS